MNSIKNFCSLLSLLGLILIVPPGRSSGQEAPAQLDARTRIDLGCCGKTIPIIAKKDIRAFKADRVKATLHGIWRGQVAGEYDKRFLADDGFLNVDYYMVIDTKNEEVLIIEQLSPKRSTSKARPNAPVWSFLMCGGHYLPPAPAQIHEFQKVSDNIEEARAILETSTGLKFTGKELDGREPFLSAAWGNLVEEKYFDQARFPAFAFGLFKPFKIEPVENEEGVPAISIAYATEYRGGGATAAKFTPGLPIRGFESAQFIGVTTESGDFLVCGLGNGKEMKKEATEGGLIDVFFEKVVIGPLDAQPFGIGDVFYDDVRNEITLTWASTTGQKFTVERSTDFKNWNEVGTIEGTENESRFTDRNLPSEGEPIYYRVRR